MRRVLFAVMIALIAVALVQSASSAPAAEKAATPTTAVLWVASAGSPFCVRSTVGPVDYAKAKAANNVCATGPEAYKLAHTNDGDQILLENTGPFTAPWDFTKAMAKTTPLGTCDFNYGGTPDYFDCEHFLPATGQVITFRIASKTVPQIRVCVPDVWLDHITVDETTYVDKYGTTVSAASIGVGSGDNLCGTTAPHDDLFSNSTLGGQAAIVGGSANVWYVNDHAKSTLDFPWQFGGAGNNGTLPNTTDSGVVGVVFDGFNFGNTDSLHHHMECIHWNGHSVNGIIAASQFRQCPVYSISQQASGGPITGGITENNFFDRGNGGGPYRIDCASPGCVVSDNTIRFNSFHGGGWQLQCGSSASPCNISGNEFYGNLDMGCVSIYISHGAQVVGDGFIDKGYNVTAGGKAGTCTASTDAFHATVNYVAPGSPHWNLDLDGPQTATGFVKGSQCKASSMLTLTGKNIHGTTRCATNAGAS